MSTLGFSLDITHLLNERAFLAFSQWIGSSNVLRNQKIVDFKVRLQNNETLDQSYSFIKKNKDLSFLKDIPPQILRNASTKVFDDLKKSQKGIRKFPKIKSKYKKRNCLITKELFFLEKLNDNQTRLCIKNHDKKGNNFIFSIVLPYPKDKLNNQFYISRSGSRFSLSGSFDNGEKLKTNSQLLEDFSHLTESELKEITTGVDLGVIRPIQTSDGLTLKYSISEKEKLKELNRKKAHYQRILARKKRLNKNKTKKCESKKQEKVKEKISKASRKIANIRDNACHHWSKEIVEKSGDIIIFEDLKIKNMTKKAKKKVDKCGRKYLRNNSKAKSGLNRSILNISWGKTKVYSKYKANLKQKATFDENPKDTSKTHFECMGKNTSRPKQDILICHDCNVVVNADENASKVIAFRGIQAIKKITFNTKKKRQIKNKKPVVEEQSLLKKSRSVGVAIGNSSQLYPCANADIRPQNLRHTPIESTFKT